MKKSLFSACILLVFCWAAPPIYASEAAHVLGPIESLAKGVGALLVVGIGILAVFLIVRITRWYNRHD